MRAAGQPIRSLAGLPLIFPWFFVCVSYMNYDPWADTAGLNDLNVSNALCHWSCNFFLKWWKERCSDTLVVTWKMNHHVQLALKNNVREAFWLQIFTFIFIWDNTFDILLMTLVITQCAKPVKTSDSFINRLLVSKVIVLYCFRNCYHFSSQQNLFCAANALSRLQDLLYTNLQMYIYSYLLCCKNQ